jgi:hypothetical protein
MAKVGSHRDGRPAGHPKSGGRKKGSKNKITLASSSQAIIDKAKAAGITPLEYMLNILRDEKQSQEVRMEMAKAAAPYVHPKLQTTKIQGDKDAPLFDLSGLTDNELAFLRRTILKAQPVSEGAP